MNNQFLFKPENYEKWSEDALNKVTKVIDSCITESHLETAKAMTDHFILMLAINDTYPDDIIQDISKQLYFYLALKESNI
jgi:hypothetical protein